MYLSLVAKYIRLTWEIKKINVLIQLEYRVSFIMQLLFSVIIHTAFVLLWVLFFKKIPTVGSWQLKDTATIIAVAWAGDAIMGLLAGNIHYLARMIAQGQLDYYMILPHNLLWHIAVSKIELHYFGSLLVSCVYFYLFGKNDWQHIVLFMGMSLISAAIMFNVVLITQSIGFYVGNFENAAKKWIDAVYALVYYPYTVFSGLLQFLAIVVAPAYFIGAVPAQLIHHFDGYFFLLLLGYWAVTFVFALLLFNRGLRRYESGSLIQVKM